MEDPAVPAEKHESRFRRTGEATATRTAIALVLVVCALLLTSVAVNQSRWWYYADASRVLDRWTGRTYYVRGSRPAPLYDTTLRVFAAAGVVGLLPAGIVLLAARRRRGRAR